MVEIFRHTGDRFLRCAWAFSGGASSLEYVGVSNVMNSLDFVGAITNRPESRAEKGYRIARDNGMEPVFLNPFKYPNTEEGRVRYWQAVEEKLDEMEADVLCLSGLLKRFSIIAGQFLDGRYGQRVLNVHPAPLDILARLEGRRPIDIGREGVQKAKICFDGSYENGNMLVARGAQRLYTGDDAVSMAVLYGERETCSTIHSVTEEEDGGPILVQSKRVPIDQDRVSAWLDRNAYDKIADYAHDEVQGPMKAKCDGPAFAEALRLLAEGRMAIYKDHVELDGKPLPYGGHRLAA